MPKPPPYDQNGLVEPHDHDEITDECFVIRKISERQLCRDKNGRLRISSKAYQGSSEAGGGMSIDIPSFMAADDINPQKWVTTPRWIGSVRLEVEVLRRLQLKVGFDPLPNKQCSDENPYHGEVWGEFSKRVKREIANHANWFVEIPDADVA